MQPDRRQPRRGDELSEPVCDPVRPQRPPARPAKHVTARAGRRPPGLGVHPKDRHGQLVQRDGPRGRLSLRVTVGDLPADRDPLIGNRQLAALKVDIGPPQPRQLAAPQSGDRTKPPQRVQRVVAVPAQEHAELLRRLHCDLRPPPGLTPRRDPGMRPNHRPHPPRTWRPQPQRRIAADQLLLHRNVERPPDRGPHSLQRRRRQRLVIPVHLHPQGVEQPLDVTSPQLAQPDPADAGGQVLLNVRPA